MKDPDGPLVKSELKRLNDQMKSLDDSISVHKRLESQGLAAVLLTHKTVASVADAP